MTKAMLCIIQKANYNYSNRSTLQNVKQLYSQYLTKDNTFIKSIAREPNSY